MQSTLFAAMFSELLVSTTTPLSLQSSLQKAVAQFTTAMYESYTRLSLQVAISSAASFELSDAAELT